MPRQELVSFRRVALQVAEELLAPLCVTVRHNLPEHYVAEDSRNRGDCFQQDPANALAGFPYPRSGDPQLAFVARSRRPCRLRHPRRAVPGHAAVGLGGGRPSRGARVPLAVVLQQIPILAATESVSDLLIMLHQVGIQLWRYHPPQPDMPFLAQARTQHSVAPRLDEEVALDCPVTDEHPVGSFEPRRMLADHERPNGFLILPRQQRAHPTRWRAPLA